MTIVLPITTDTAPLAIQSIKWAGILLGGRFDAKLLLVPYVTCDSVPVYQAIGHFFQSVHVLPTHQVGLDNVFSDVQAHLKRTESKEHWFWWEPSFTVLRSDPRELRDILAICGITPSSYFPIQSRKEFVERGIIFTTTERTTFETLEQVHKEVDFRLWIHRGCTDGSLIERLSEERNSTAVNVPGHAMEYYEPKIETPPGTVDILIVTYAKDFPWLEYCLKAIKKFATGFRKVIVALPREDAELFYKSPLVYNEVQVWMYTDAPPGKGFVMHAAKICQADLITDADFILHMDADCIMKEPNDAGHYFQNGKPVMVWRPYESLKGPKLSGVVSDCYQWKLVSEQTLGMPLHAYTMCRHPTVFPREIYKPFREQVERTQGEPFEQWFCKQKNDHPQGVAEFPSLGGFCYERFRDLFTWVDCMATAPRDLLQNFWSHGGLDHHIGEGWLNGNKVDNNAQKTMTARMWIESKLA